MAITVTAIAKVSPHGGHIEANPFTIAYTTGTNYATNGVVTDISNAVPPGVKVETLRKVFAFANGASGYIAEYVPGTTFANGKFKLWTGGVEVTNATSLNGITLNCFALFAHKPLFN